MPDALNREPYGNVIEESEDKMISSLLYGMSLLVKAAIGVAIPYVALLVTLLIIHDARWLKGKRFFIGQYLFVIYLVSLAGILGFLCDGWNFGRDISYNLIPFSQESPLLMILNFIVFVPLGIFLPWLFKRFKDFRSVALLGFISSFLVELMQMFFLGRLGDIDDIVFNTLGCCFGYGLYRLLSMLMKKYKKTKVGYGTLALVFALIALLWGFPYRGVPGGYLLLLMFGLNMKGLATLKIIESASLILEIAAIAIGLKRKGDFLAKPGAVLATFALILSIFCLFTMG